VDQQQFLREFVFIFTKSVKPLVSNISFPATQGRIWYQLHLAHSRGADQIWVFNVGDIKPLELPINFALNLAWDINSIPANDFHSFFRLFSSRNLPPGVSEEAALLLCQSDQLISLRKHEHIESDTFSILNYNEAQSIVGSWESLLKKAEQLYCELEPQARPAFFELVLHPIKASFIYTKLRVCQAKNQLYGRQRRNETNKVAQEVLDLFNADFDLSEEYHSLLGGKWNHMLRQPHFGYRETWHAPSRDMVGGICYVQTRQNSNPIVGYMGIAVEGTQGIRPGLTNEESDRTHPSLGDLVPGLTLPPLETFGLQDRYFEIYRRGTAALDWKVFVPYNWIKTSPDSGSLNEFTNDVRVHIEVDWPNVPPHFNQIVQLAVSSTLGDYEHIHLPIVHREISSTSFRGFVESDRCVAIPATGFSRPVRDGCFASQYQILPFLGRTRSGAVGLSLGNFASYPASAASPNEDFLEYDVFVFSEREQPASLILFFTMVLDTNPSDPLTYDVMIDGTFYGPLRLIEDPSKVGDLPPGWDKAVQDNVWKKTLQLPEGIESGRRVVKVRLQQPNILLEKLVLNLGGMRDSYLGPPTSTFI
jgi:hypothetical protein